MTNFHIHPGITDITVQVYSQDKTSIKRGDEAQEEVEITSGIKQGWTVSTTPFKLITYSITEKLNETDWVQG